MADDLNVELQVHDVRLSFADNLFEPQEGDLITEGKHKGKVSWSWSFNLLIPKSNKALVKQIRSGMADAVYAAFQEDIKIKPEKMPLQDGDDVEYAGYEDHWYLKCTRTAYAKDGAPPPKRPFKIIGARKVENEDGKMEFPLLKESDGILYAGCYVSVAVRFWSNKHPKRGTHVSCSIEGVQFWRKGEAFGGGPKIDVNKAFRENEDADEPEEAPRRRSRDDDDEAPRSRRGRSRDDDADEAPKRRRSRDDDDEDAAPRRKPRNAIDDDDDDDGLTRRKKPASRDDEDDVPRRRRPADDDDAPPRRRPRDDDEDEAPKRRRPVDDDDEDLRPAQRRRPSRDID